MTILNIFGMTMSEISEIQKPGFPSCLQQNFEFLKSWFWNIDKDSIAWHPTEHFYPLSSTFLLMAFICVNYCPTPPSSGQNRPIVCLNVQCCVYFSCSDLWFGLPFSWSWVLSRPCQKTIHNIVYSVKVLKLEQAYASFFSSVMESLEYVLCGIFFIWNL